MGYPGKGTGGDLAPKLSTCQPSCVWRSIPCGRAQWAWLCCCLACIQWDGFPRAHLCTGSPRPAAELCAWSTHWQIIDSELVKGTLAMDNEEVPVGSALIFLQHSIILGQASGYTSQQGRVQRVPASLLLGSVDPSQVGELRVDRDPSSYQPSLWESSAYSLKAMSMGQTKGDVQWVGKQDRSIWLCGQKASPPRRLRPL